MAVTSLASLAFLLVGCGASGDVGSDTGQNGDSPGAARPVHGVIVTATDTAISVTDSSSAKIDISVSGDTKISKERAAALSSVTVGVCATVTEVASPAAGASSSAGASATPVVNALSIMISEKVNGSCQVGGDGSASSGPAGGPAGSGPAGSGPAGSGPAGGPPPGGAASDGGQTPSGGGSADAAARPTGRPLSGEVTAVSGNKIVLSSADRESGAAPAAPSAMTSTVLTSARTTFSGRSPVDRSALAPGVCISAAGSPGDGGILLAETITVLLNDSACTSGAPAPSPSRS